MKPGIYLNLDKDKYHGGPGISKSGLWKLYSQSPRHFRYGFKDKSQAFDFGEACHLAILEPNEFEARVHRGPEDRRGNKWKDIQAWCEHEGKLLLIAKEYDDVLAVRDAVHADQWVNKIVTTGKPVIEASGYWHDPATKELCRCRPDLYREDVGVIVDLKSTVSARPDAFAKSVVNYGYHAQEALYSDGWRALGKQLDGFVFLAFEKRPPYACAVYELPPSIVNEGRAIMRQALEKYSECRKANDWPGYGIGVQELEFKHWNYRLTSAPPFEEGDAEA